MSDQRSTTPRESPPRDDTSVGGPSSTETVAPTSPRVAQSDGAPPSDEQPPPTGASVQEAQAGPSRRHPISISYTLPLPMGDGVNGNGGGGQGGDGGDTITWTFEIFPGPEEGGEGNAAGVQGEHDGPTTDAPAPDATPPGPGPRIGPFGLADARPPDPGQRAPTTGIGHGGPANILPFFFPNGPGAGAGAGPGPDAGAWPHILTHLMPIFASGLADRRPDPAKAAELIRALPTVDKALMDRVDRVVSAADDDEDESGWKCSICFEGADVAPAEGSTAIKATPCHHLFHSGCLEPWFRTRTSCPMCRESLDALNTQGDNETQSSIRPRPTRQSTNAATAHPYARPSATRSPPRPSVGIDLPTHDADAVAGLDEEPMESGLSTPRLNAPIPDMSSPTSPGARSGQRPSTLPQTPALADATGPTTGQPPAHPDSTPRRMPAETLRRPFPMPMPMPVPAGIGMGPPGLGNQRMPFMAIINIGPNGPEQARQIHPPTASDRQATPSTAPALAPSAANGDGAGALGGELTDGPLHASPMPMDRLSSPVPGPTPGHSVVPEHPQTGLNAHTDPTRPRPVFPHRRSHVDVGPRSEDAARAPTPAPPFTATPPPPHPSEGHPFFPRFTIFTQAPPAPAPEPAQSSRPGTPRPSLASYISSKERDLGLACAFPDCLYAHEGPESIQEQDKMELLAIRPSTADGLERSISKTSSACAHRWHRDCLEKSHPTEFTDERGRQWTACGACGAKGWVTGRDADSRSEGEVERLVHWS